MDFIFANDSMSLLYGEIIRTLKTFIMPQKLVQQTSDRFISAHTVNCRPVDNTIWWINWAADFSDVEHSRGLHAKSEYLTYLSTLDSKRKPKANELVHDLIFRAEIIVILYSFPSYIIYTYVRVTTVIFNKENVKCFSIFNIYSVSLR